MPFIGKAIIRSIGESNNKYQNEAKGTSSGPCHCMETRQRGLFVLRLFSDSPVILMKNNRLQNPCPKFGSAETQIIDKNGQFFHHLNWQSNNIFNEE